MLPENKDKSQTKEIIFCMGLPGAGKSTVAKLLYPTFSFLCADAIKESHPEYSPETAPELHAWSMSEFERQFQLLVTGQDSCVVDGTGVNAEAMVRRMTLAQSFGFTVTLLYVQVSLPTALVRAARRERVVPESVIRDKALNIATSFEICSRYADRVRVFKND